MLSCVSDTFISVKANSHLFSPNVCVKSMFLTFISLFLVMANWVYQRCFVEHDEWHWWIWLRAVSVWLWWCDLCWLIKWEPFQAEWGKGIEIEKRTEKLEQPYSSKGKGSHRSCSLETPFRMPPEWAIKVFLYHKASLLWCTPLGLGFSSLWLFLVCPLPSLVSSLRYICCHFSLCSIFFLFTTSSSYSLLLSREL